MDIQSSAHPSLPSTDIGDATAEAQFAVGGSRLICTLPGSNRLNKRKFKIRVAGRVKGPGTINTFTAALYFGTSATIGSNTEIASTGAIATGASATNWALEADCFYDSVSGRIQGLQKGWVHATALAQAILSNPATSVDLSLEALGLTVTGLFSVSDVANSAIVDVFEVIPE